MPCLGIVGTLVWDTIHGPDGGEPITDWGGIAYSLAAWEAAAPPGWTMVPIIKVGADLRESADEFLSTLDGVACLDFVVTVPEPNNRVGLFYHDHARRCERLTGGVPGWTAEEIVWGGLSCDALYVNFISGWELDMAAVTALRSEFHGPTWCDVHSLIFGVAEDGVREPRSLEGRADWLGSFDLVQVNEDELEVLSVVGPLRSDRLADLLADGAEALFVTLGPAGAEWVARTETRWAPGPAEGTMPAVVAGTAAVERIAPEGVADPTGCGDVWGLTCFGALLGGAGIPEAVRRANRLAAETATNRGTSGLASKLSAAMNGADLEPSGKTSMIG